MNFKYLKFFFFILKQFTSSLTIRQKNNEDITNSPWPGVCGYGQICLSDTAC